MIDITKLYLGSESQGDFIRYGQGKPPLSFKTTGEKPKTAAERRPVTVWNCTRTCNLSCIHCYTDSEKKNYPNELSTREARGMLRDLADFKIPALLVSGGEPLLDSDLLSIFPGRPMSATITLPMLSLL